MVMDVLVVAIFISAIFFSMHRGLVLSIVGFVRCALSGILAFWYCNDVEAFLVENTGIDEFISEKVRDAINNSVVTSWKESGPYALLPDLFKYESDGYVVQAVTSTADKITDITLGIVSFLLIIFGVAIITSVIEHLFSKNHHGGFTGFLDWLLGLLLGIIVGAFYVFAFLALIIPFTSVVAPGLSSELLTSLDESYFAAELYNNNILLVIFRDFI